MSGQPPEYIITSEVGAEHERVYTIEARLGDKLLGVGTGTSKKKAQQVAAENALSRR